MLKLPRMFAPALLAMLASSGCVDVRGPTTQETPAITLASTAHSPDSGSLAVHCGMLIDGVSTQPMHDVTLLVRNGRITAIERGSREPPDLPRLDLRDYTCLPGLIDMHTHLTDRPEDTADLTVYFRRKPDERFALSRQHAAATLQAGFTTVRNVGTYVAGSDRELRDAINSGQAVGPRMQVSGPYLTIPGGGGDLLVPGVPEHEIPAQVRVGVARGPAAFRAKALELLDGDVDLLKVIASGAVLAFGGVPGEPEMNPEELAAVVAVAHAAGRKVAAHAHGARSIKEAILAGADTIEHASLMDAEAIELARVHRVALAMDVYNGDYIDTEGRRLGWPEEFLRKNIETTEAQRQAFSRAHAAGVPIVYGTDAGVFPHGLNARQFPIMVQRGMSPMEAIQAATSVAARYLGWADRVGRLAPGLQGDIIAVEGDPLEDITRLQNVAVVIKGGLAFKLPTR